MASDFFKPGTRPPGPDCTDIAAWGSPSVIVPQYIAKIKVEAEDTYPSNACAPYYYSNAKIDNLLVTNTLGTTGVTKVVGNTGTFLFVNLPRVYTPYSGPSKQP